ncbi:MAG: AAA family ATPase [Spirochaetota bacterium]|nr:AAA family ATPase [Spirochaetota bacterium]
MITKINLNGVACFKRLATLETDKKVNLIYGLNGTGKSTLSDFLYDVTDSDFSNCSVEGLNSEEILVYNQRFIRDYFYQPDNLKGIFTLSKENKEAEENVKSAEQEIAQLEEDKKSNTDIITTHNSDLSQKKQNTENKIWEIKSSYAGGDRVLEYCLAGLMGRKESLFNHLLGFPKPENKIDKTTDQLKKEVEAIQGATAQKYDLLSTINFTAHQIESNQLFQKAIIGNQDSTVAELINKFDNSDWVKQGLEYIPEEIKSDGKNCPFCQEKTITKILVENIQNYFDTTYENDINDLNNQLSNYETGYDSLPHKEKYDSNPFILEKKSEFENLYNSVIQCLNSNLTKIKEKIKTPSQKITLSESSNAIDTFNQFIININKAISEHNAKIDDKDASLNAIKKQFWNIMRCDYDQTILAYQNDKTSIESKISDIRKKISDIDKKISDQKAIVSEQLKKTVNIDEAIGNINNGLIELGIDGFKIEKHSDILYKIARVEQCDNTFQTLSEGEKMSRFN